MDTIKPFLKVVAASDKPQGESSRERTFESRDAFYKAMQSAKGDEKKALAAIFLLAQDLRRPSNGHMLDALFDAVGYVRRFIAIDKERMWAFRKIRKEDYVMWEHVHNTICSAMNLPHDPVQMEVHLRGYSIEEARRIFFGIQATLLSRVEETT